jgi:hypothetical protein
MDRALQQHQPGEALRGTEGEARASVDLTRFTIRPDRRATLVDVACAAASSTEVPQGSDWELLVELEDGDWLQISITRPGTSSDDASAYLDLAEGLLGDEEGVLIACALVGDEGASAPRPEGLPEPSSKIATEASTEKAPAVWGATKGAPS